MPSLARGEVTPPLGDTPGDLSSVVPLPLAAAAAAVALVVLMGVVSCSLPKGVAGALPAAALPVLPEGAVSISWYQACRACAIQQHYGVYTCSVVCGLWSLALW